MYFTLRLYLLLLVAFLSVINILRAYSDIITDTEFKQQLRYWKLNFNANCFVIVYVGTIL